jgi:CRP-like cAMP-binding protein
LGKCGRGTDTGVFENKRSIGKTTLINPDFLAPLLRRWERRSQLSDQDRSAIEALPCTSKSFSKDAYLVQEGSRPTECALLVKGFAYRQKLVQDGARQIISIHIPGEFVDLQNCMLGTADHNVQSLNRSEAALISASALRALGESHPAIGLAMWLDTLIDSSIFREWVVNVGRRDARTRIAHLLCELALRLEASGAGTEDTYQFPLTQDQLADATGLTPVHTNRTLQSLRKDGLISLSSGALKVLDWERLREVGDFSERYLHHAV